MTAAAMIGAGVFGIGITTATIPQYSSAAKTAAKT
jgi:hypothetical protein